MDTLTAIYNRRTVHSWADTTLENDTLQIFLEAAHQAPCHKKTWPWRFIVVGQQTRERIIPIGTTLAAAKAGIAPSPKVERAVRGKICHPAALVAVVLSRSDDAFRAREDYAAFCQAGSALKVFLTTTVLFPMLCQTVSLFNLSS